MNILMLVKLEVIWNELLMQCLLFSDVKMGHIGLLSIISL